MQRSGWSKIVKRNHGDHAVSWPSTWGTTTQYAKQPRRGRPSSFHSPCASK